MPDTLPAEYIEPKPLFFCVGVDLGSVNDSTAITVLEVLRGYERTPKPQPCPIWNYKPEPEAPWNVDAHFLVRLLHRPRLGTSYPAIIEQIASILEDLPPLPRKPLLVMDGTGLGGPVVQQARKQGLKPISIAITGGQIANVSGMDWSVPKGLLVGELRLVMHRKRLKVAQGFAARETLATELQAFTAKLSASGRATFEAAGSENDDTVLSLSLALFAAKQRMVETIRVQPLPY